MGCSKMLKGKGSQKLRNLTYRLQTFTMGMNNDTFELIMMTTTVHWAKILAEFGQNWQLCGQ